MDHEGGEEEDGRRQHRVLPFLRRSWGYDEIMERLGEGVLLTDLSRDGQSMKLKVLWEIHRIATLYELNIVKNLAYETNKSKELNSKPYRPLLDTEEKGRVGTYSPLEKRKKELNLKNMQMQLDALGTWRKVQEMCEWFMEICESAHAKEDENKGEGGADRHKRPQK